MKSIFFHPMIILLARVLLGGLFIISSIDKIADPAAFTASVLNYRLVNPTVAVAAATMIPPLELICGLGLLLGLYPRGSALLITIMLVCFTGIVLSALIRGLDISCGCFTQDPGAEKIGTKKILENAGMILLGIYLLTVRDFGYTLLRIPPLNRWTSKDGPPASEAR